MFASTDTQTVFTQTLTEWTALFERYCLLRSASDTLAASPHHHPEHQNEQSALECEIDDLECALEGSTQRVAVASVASLPDINAVLHVAITDLRIRHQIPEDDMTVLLILTAQRALQYSARLRGGPK